MAKTSTQSDVAQRAGVSTATVSRVLNGSNLVRDDVRKRVEEAMAELNYIPDESARSLATRKSRTLGAIIPTLNNAIFAVGINALEQAARERGYTLVISISNYDPDSELMLVRQMLERGVDGLMLVGNHHHDEVYRLLNASAVRHVCGWSHNNNAPSPNIGFDNARAMHAVVDHLVDLGHQKIGVLAGICQNNDRATLRLDGTRQRLEHHGLDLPKQSIIQIAYSIRAARAALPDLLKSDVSAVICGNDVIAYGAVFAAQDAGLRISENLAITGFDNLSLSKELRPSITTVNVPAADMGSTIANYLVDAIESNQPVASCKFETDLLVRETTIGSTHKMI
ncbi:LacI family DNA-binding transcriptional regulator [Parasulfitobacter algicola]|uniref:LacI family DNA-binding transcriptional regulator n=1 Tax=Parasulfitobacter algicola TaxID=2614809 RepID=A0ABX2ITD4_9RHOB|nr:LacI family DNA-binding transcriptional regulator [Sulfitobacter algicola]NSX56164.1 LacI family DNA-binding transcriptional regulator [Sulfitobacter algicola]